MPFYDQTIGNKKTKFELASLLAAGFAVAAVLTLAVGGSESLNPISPSSQSLILGASVLMLGCLGVLFLARSLWTSRRKARLDRSEARRLNRNLATAEAMISAEPQVLVFWENSGPPQIVTHTLTGVQGVPGNNQELLRFGFWLDGLSGRTLKEHLDLRFTEGKAFSIIVKTAAGAHVEADGRAAGGRAVLRIRDTVGYKQDLAVIFDHHATLARDIRASRKILNELEFPAWLRGLDKRLIWVNQAYVKAVEAQDDDEVILRQIELLESRQRSAVDAALRKNNRTMIVFTSS